MVLEQLPVDPRDHPARVDHDELGARFQGDREHPSRPRDNREHVPLRRRGADEVEAVRVVHGLDLHVFGGADELQADRRRGPHRLLSHVDVDERGDLAGLGRGTGHGAAERGLPGVEPADQHDGAGLLDGPLDEGLVLVQTASSDA